MKYGECLKLIFDSFYQDRSNTNTTYTLPLLKEAISKLPSQWKYEIASDFSIIGNEINKNILSCDHPKENIKMVYDGCEQCLKCYSKRFMELIDKDPNSYDESKSWSEWKVWGRI